MNMELLKEVFALAQQAYWKNERHCGAEYEEARCRECEHWLACVRIGNIQKMINPLNKREE